MNDDTSSTQPLEQKRSVRVPECVDNLWMMSESSKTTLIVGKENIQPHILGLISCDYVREFLSHKKNDSSGNNSSTLEAHEQLMDYTFTGNLEIEGLETDTVLEILRLASCYGLEKLQTALCGYLPRTISVFNVCAICATAQSLHLHLLLEICRRFMDLHASAIIRSESFDQLPADVLKQTLSRDTFYADELDIFEAVKRWCTTRANDEDVLKVLNEVRLPLIGLDDLLKVVGPSKLIPAQRFEQVVISIVNNTVKLNHRGLLIREGNVATADHRASVLGREPLRIVFGQRRLFPPQDWDEKMLQHVIDDPIGILLALGERYIINHIALRLFDRELCSFSYYVEVSANGDDWERVVDYSTRLRRSVQHISFKPRVVRFIRVVGTYSTRFNRLCLTNIEALYTERTSNSSYEEDEAFRFMCKANGDLSQRNVYFRRSGNQIFR